jgi:Flp pilus assembly protein TadG
MTLKAVSIWLRARQRADRFDAKLRRNESGATAVEFALVSLPFLMLVFGIIGVGLFFFTTFSLENAIESASRPIRTGEAQTTGMTKEAFKAKVCGYAPMYVDCDGKMRVNVQNFSLEDIITPPTCTDAGGALVPPASTSYAPGAANRIILVTVCYQFDLTGSIPFLKLGSMSNGATMIQASTTFKVEPYS